MQDFFSDIQKVDHILYNKTLKNKKVGIWLKKRYKNVDTHSRRREFGYFPW